MINFKNNISDQKWFYSSFFPLKEISREYKRPWKVVTLLLGMAFLFYGAIVWDYPDWDIGVSIIMGLLTYFLAPWSVSNFIKAIKYRPSKWVLYLIASIICELLVVDWSYYAWHTFAGNTMIRYENFLASSYMYLVCGFLWLYKGCLKEFYKDVTQNIVVEKI